MFTEAAQRAGVDLVLATDRCHVLEDPWGDRAIAVRFEDPEFSLAAIRAQQFDAIVAVGDRPAVLAAQAAETLGIRFHSVASVRACHDKFLARQLYQAAGLAVPQFFRVPLNEDARAAAGRAPFPCVLKPLGLSASRGVIRANNPDEFVAAFDRIKALLEKSRDILMASETQNRYLQVESYIEGREFAVEGMVSDGVLTVFSLFDKPDPLEGPYFEETIYVTPSRESSDTQSAIIATVQRAVRALGLSWGPIHAEARVNSQGVWMLETAARPIGGLCSKILRFDAGSLEELIIRHAIGEDIASARLSGPAAGVMMIPIPRGGIYCGVSGLEQASSVAGIDEVIITAKEGQQLVPLPDGASYLGFLFARGQTPALVEEALRRAHSNLAFRLATTLPTINAT
jgi:biotin carboxylase